MKICTMLLSLTVLAGGIGSAVAIEKVPYAPLASCEVIPQQAGKFCFESGGQRREYTFAVSVPLRRAGAWVKSEYVDHLTSENRAIVEGYSEYSVRYLTPVTGGAESSSFLAEVEFNWVGMSMKTYVLGEIDAQNKVTLTGFSDGSGYDGSIRATLKTVKNVFSIFRGENPNRVGVNENKANDRERIKPVADVVRQYESTQKNIVRP